MPVPREDCRRIFSQYDGQPSEELCVFSVSKPLLLGALDVEIDLLPYALAQGYLTPDPEEARHRSQP